jgi:transcriptional regulator with XRE-family HTH domain
LKPRKRNRKNPFFPTSRFERSLESDIAQADFANRIGVSQSYLSAVEQGRNEVGTEVLLAISREFGKSLEWLLTGEE